MSCNKQTDDFEILDNGLVLLPTDKSNLIIHVAASENFNFDLELIFTETKDGKRNLTVHTISEPKKIVFSCTNFEKAGAGTIEPIEVAEAEGKKIYLLFWSYQPKTKIRKVEYTILAKEGA